jgi:hypothetical protein
MNMKKTSHRIRIKVEIIECDGVAPELATPQRLGAGEFELNIDEAVAGSIDECEQALLATNYPALRDALSQHLGAWSKKRPSNKVSER